MTNDVVPPKVEPVTVMLYILIAFGLVVVVFFGSRHLMSSTTGSDYMSPAGTNVLVFAPEKWLKKTDATDEQIKDAFQVAYQAAEIARDAGYVVLYSESAMMVPDGAFLTPETAAAMGFVQ